MANFAWASDPLAVIEFDGYVAWTMGKDVEASCPYYEGTSEALYWRKGWYLGEAEREKDERRV